MPKKFKGENSKATSARERKATKAAEEKEMKNKAIEDAYWQDDDKLINKKNNRKVSSNLICPNKKQKKTFIVTFGF